MQDREKLEIVGADSYDGNQQRSSLHPFTQQIYNVLNALNISDTKQQVWIK